MALIQEFLNELQCAFGFHAWHQIRMTRTGQKHYVCERPNCNAEKWEWI
jgi:hypothetical protein